MQQLAVNVVKMQYSDVHVVRKYGIVQERVKYLIGPSIKTIVQMINSKTIY